MILRYLDGPHRPGEVAPRTHPVPEHIEVVPLGLREPVNAEAVHSWGAAILSNLHPRLKDEALGNVKRLHRLPWLLHQLLPRRVDLKMTWPARSLRSSPITGPSSLLRTGPPLCLASGLFPLWPSPRQFSLSTTRGPTAPISTGRSYRDDRFSCSLSVPATSSRHLYTGH